MADSQAQTPVPARWRIVFAALLVLVFWFAGWGLMRKDAPTSSPAAGDGLDARIRLQTAAVALSSGKLAPRVLILTDRPDFYENEGGAYPEFQFFQNGFHVVDPESVPGWGLGGPRENCSLLVRFFRHGISAGKPEQDHPQNLLQEHLGKFSPGGAAFDVILLDCMFPERLLSRRLRLFSPMFFDRAKRDLMRSGGVFAVVLPPDHPEDSACILAFLQHSFGNAGALRFGERTFLASGLDTVPNFDLDKLNATAEFAGYYSLAGGVPNNAISLILDDDYSDSIPASLLEAAGNVKIHRYFTPFCAVFARAELQPRLLRVLPDGFPLQTVCAWGLGILLAVYPFLRYFISWKPVHKQAFRTFEDMFYLTGALSLFLMFTQEIMPDYGIHAALYLVIFVFLFYGTIGRRWKWFKFSLILQNPYGRVLFALLALLMFGLAFFLPPTGFLTELLALAGVSFSSMLVRVRMNEPVQPGPVIPLAYLLGIASSLAVFAMSLFFPFGPIMFAAVICGLRLIFLNN